MVCEHFFNPTATLLPPNTGTAMPLPPPQKPTAFMICRKDGVSTIDQQSTKATSSAASTPFKLGQYQFQGDEFPDFTSKPFLKSY